MDTAIDITDASFRSQVLESPVLTITDLWAEWCEPCKRLAPILEQIAAAYPGRVRIAKLNVDENPETPGMYGVMGLPTLLVFKGGELVETLVGYMPKDKIVGRLAPHLN